MSDEIRIYVADLAAYNAGYLHGIWIDACGELDDIKAQITEMLAASPEDCAEEYAIHDCEGFGGYALGEYAGIETAYAVACFIAEYPDFGGELLNHFGGDLGEAKAAAEENYCDCYHSLADYAEELTEQTTQIPANLAYYIDYECMGRDIELNGDVFTIETGYGEVHIFWSINANRQRAQTGARWRGGGRFHLCSRRYAASCWKIGPMEYGYWRNLLFTSVRFLSILKEKG